VEGNGQRPGMRVEFILTCIPRMTD
jgi:hypothetical protein